jgi:hypothetical protein
VIPKNMIRNFSIVLLLALVFAYFTRDVSKKQIANVEKKVEQIAEKTPDILPPKKVVKNLSNDKISTEVNNIHRFFSKGMDKFPFIETVTYSSRVPWLKGRPAWIVDYANYYQTSRHFIARSLNGKEDYTSQNISPGDKFNIIKLDANISFHMLVDLSNCTLDFSYIDNQTGENHLIKTYKVGVGRKDEYSPSGTLTPLGKYKLGEKIAIYKQGVEHYFQNKKTHMIEVFGTRWIPFGEELENCTDSAKGYGLHGLPFVLDEKTNEYKENIACLGGYSSDGCIRLSERDINEIFAIVITKPTVIEIVKDKSGASSKISKR